MMMSNHNITDTLNVLQWNANGLKNKIFEFYAFLTEKQIDIAFVCETFYKHSDLIPAHPDYINYRFDRNTDNNRASGGVAIFIKRSIKHQLLPKPNTSLLESLGIKLHLSSGSSLAMFSIYMPGSASVQQIRAHFKNDLRLLTRNNRNYFIIGDFNAKHRLWNCNQANVSGTILASEYWRNNFIINFPAEPTHIPSDINKRPSYIDLAIHDGQFNLTDSTTHTSDSDHQMITFAIQLSDRIAHQSPSYQFNFNQADWGKFQNYITRELPDSILRINEVETTEQIDEMVSKLEETVLEAQNVAVPLTRRTPYGVVLPTYIKDKINHKNRLRRLMQRNPARKAELVPQVNALTKEIKSDIESLVNMNFNHKISQIPTDDNYKKLWQTSKFLRNRRNLMPHLQVDNNIYITTTEKAEALANQFSTNHENPLGNSNRSFTNHVSSTVRRFRNNCPPEAISPHYASTVEVGSIIKRLKNSKAPGKDRVHNRLIKKFPPNAILFLTSIINCCLRLSYFPQVWKNAKVIAIKKPNKPANTPSSYRPISLVSSLSKILERVLLTRINEHLELNNIIPDQQHGFRRAKSTVTQLNRIMQHIKSGLNSSLSTGMILFDIEKAFDRVWHDGLVYKMIKLNFPHYIKMLILNFLQNRSFHVDVNGAASTLFQLPYGTPQGCVLSPTLYNIYTHDIPIPRDCEIALFADDTAVYYSSRFARGIINTLETNAKKLLKYFTLWKIKLNEAKTQSIFFTRRRTKQLPHRPFRFGSTDIEWADSVTYLGLLLDKRLTLRSHIQHVLKKAQNTVRILYSLLSRRSKLNTKSKLLLYKVGIRPVFTYASPILNQVAKSHKKKLQVCQNKILKMIFNLPWDTRTSELHELAEIPMVTEFIEQLTESFEQRLQISD